MSSTEPNDIFDMFRQVKNHPDYVFGTIFVKGDFADGEVPEGFSPMWATEALVERGNEYLEENDCLAETYDTLSDNTLTAVEEVSTQRQED